MLVAPLMQHHLNLRIHPRPAGTGPFFDYVLSAMHHQALRARALHARLARREHWRIAESGPTSAEERWEGEGGSRRECTPGGRC